MHAPYSAGDCGACHVRVTPPAGMEEETGLRWALVTPVNDHCVSCHHELFLRPPRGHPPKQAYCTSCHAGHSSRQRSLLLDDDVTRACLDYPPPYPEKPIVTHRNKASSAVPAKATAR